MNDTLNIGKDIKSSADWLNGISVSDLYREILLPDDELVVNVNRMRTMKELDKTLYSKAKCRLPYFVCSDFNPAVRRTENFVCAKNFVLDLDNLSASGRDVMGLRKELEKDDRVCLTFVSPGNDGLKLLFCLSEKCFDPIIFKTFYKAFAKSFAGQYGIADIVDTKTCDVTRACFLSYDKNAFFREKPQPVVLKDYVDQDDPFETLMQIRGFEKEVPNVVEDTETEENGPTCEDIEAIKAILFKKKQKLTQQRQIYVPARLNEIIGGVIDNLIANNVTVDDVVDIQYGKKVKMRCDGKLAEVNVFYGNRGFTVVPTPKRGTDAELNDLLSEWINVFLSEMAA